MVQAAVQNQFAITGVNFGKQSIQQLSNLSFASDQSERRIICVTESGTITRLRCGALCSELVRLEPPSKALSLFGIANFPNLMIVSTVAGTLVLDTQGGKLVELDQAHTRVALSDSTIACGDYPGGLGVQVARNWINIFSITANYVYKTENGQKVIACATDAHSRVVGVGLGDGDLRGRGRVIVLELSQDGRLVEIARKDFVQEILGVTLSQSGLVVLTNDNGVILLDGSTLATRSHLKLNAPLKSIASFGDRVLVTTATGLLCEIAVTTSVLEVLSTRLIVNEPVTIVGSRDLFLLSQSRASRITGPDITLSRLQLPPQTSSLLQVNDSILAGIVAGEVCLFRHGGPTDCHTVSLATLPAGYPQPSDCLCVKKLGVVMYFFPHLAPPVSFNVFGGRTMDISHSLGNVSAACVFETDGSELLLTWSTEAGLTLTEGSVHLWSRPEPEKIVSMAQLTRDLVICGFESGRLSILKISRSEIASTVCDRETQLRGLRKLEVLNQRIFATTESTGVYTLSYRASDRALLFTALPASHVSGENLSISTSALLDYDHVVVGESTGKIHVMRIPSSVRSDEKNHMHGLSGSADISLCMTVVEPVASIDIGAAVVSAVSSNDGRRIVYMSASDGQFLAVTPVNHPELPSGFIRTETISDPLLRYRMMAYLGWD